MHETEWLAANHHHHHHTLCTSVDAFLPQWDIVNEPSLAQGSPQYTRGRHDPRQYSKLQPHLTDRNIVCRHSRSTSPGKALYLAPPISSFQFSVLQLWYQMRSPRKPSVQEGQSAKYHQLRPIAAQNAGDFTRTVYRSTEDAALVDLPN
jgi:hypothetical protein